MATGIIRGMTDFLGKFNIGGFLRKAKVLYESPDITNTLGLLFGAEGGGTYPKHMLNKMKDTNFAEKLQPLIGIRSLLAVIPDKTKRKAETKAVRELLRGVNQTKRAIKYNNDNNLPAVIFGSPTLGATPMGYEHELSHAADFRKMMLGSDKFVRDTEKAFGEVPEEFMSFLGSKSSSYKDMDKDQLVSEFASYSMSNTSEMISSLSDVPGAFEKVFRARKYARDNAAGVLRELRSMMKNSMGNNPASKDLGPWHSPTNPFDAMDIGKQIANSAHRRSMARDLVGMLLDPNTNQIGLDIETTGVKTALERMSTSGVLAAEFRQQPNAVATEFSVVSRAMGETHGWSRYTSESLLKRLADTSIDPKGAELFAGQLERYSKSSAVEQGYSALNILRGVIPEHIQPGKRNVIWAQGLAGFDMKVLMEMGAIESGAISRADIAALKAGGPMTASVYESVAQKLGGFYNEIYAGWQRKAGPQGQVILTDALGQLIGKNKLGGVDAPELPGLVTSAGETAYGAGYSRGLWSEYSRGYLPGVEESWINELGEWSGGRHAGAKGSNVESILRYLDYGKTPEEEAFIASLHGTTPDVRAETIIQQRLGEKMNYLDEAVHQGRFDILKLEEMKFKLIQRSAAKKDLSRLESALAAARTSGNTKRVKYLESYGGKSLWSSIIQSTESLESEYAAAVKSTPKLVTRIAESTVKPSFWKGLGKAPVGSKVLVGGITGLVGWGLLDAVFGNHRVHERHISKDSRKRKDISDKLRQQHTTGMMHVLDGSAIGHGKMMSRIGI
jgi:hypothetical protein